ncbi:ABC transporter substrate-binding protein [Agarivorans sp. TSD2052]|uniref:ABC transporter substrate-binding protein n=1 Tax=Agarivorans sp. TSD2052 TaxID=2937286 RepID=UPI00200C356A|nr:ABC transporter substrate-binding protein [Agarivorans sp. TSD2052]UPW18418.1 ABC transporter substrate-binding protein [Agarivorans sp. TSD2052]
MRRILLSLMFFGWSLAWAQPSVVFLNPGKADESFWSDVDLYAEAAAKRLGIRLRTFHSQRNHYSMIKHLEEMINQQRLPDYVMLVNEKNALPRMLTLLEGLPVYVVVLLNDLDLQQQQLRSQNPHWQKYLLSCLVPNNYWIGQQTAKEMYNKAGAQPGQVVLISGDKATPASIEREAGAVGFFQQQANLQVKQIVYGQWEELRSYQQTRVLLKRYPQLKYLWTANDHMAFGSLAAIQEAGLEPGKDIYVGTVNTSEQALSLLEKGDISALGGGHFIAAGWGLSLIYHHAAGRSLPSKINAPMFQLLQVNTPFYQQLKSKDWSNIPFESLLQSHQLGSDHQVVR